MKTKAKSSSTCHGAKLRPCVKADLPALLEVEQSVHIIPWTEDTFKLCFQSGITGWVIEQDRKLIGFIIVSYSKQDCHVLNLCVASAHQRQGWGTKLLEHSLTHAKIRGVGIIYLEVRKSNQRAISLYRKMKFHLVGERKNYYPSPTGTEDAFIFAKSLHDDIMNSI